MSDYKLRLFITAAELELKINSLRRFINTVPYVKLLRVEQDRLDRQLYIMDEYLQVLRERLV